MASSNNTVRVGVVSSVNSADNTARVYYPDSKNMVSGWLYVMQRGASSWMPQVNDRVICLIGSGDDSDGYILGGIP